MRFDKIQTKLDVSIKRTGTPYICRVMEIVSEVTLRNCTNINIKQPSSVRVLNCSLPCALVEFFTNDGKFKYV
jgi:hypothetical protein